MLTLQQAIDNAVEMKACDEEIDQIRDIVDCNGGWKEFFEHGECFNWLEWYMDNVNGDHENDEGLCEAYHKWEWAWGKPGHEELSEKFKKAWLNFVNK